MFEEYDFDTIMERMLSNVSDNLDKREGSVIYDAIAPAALELADFYISLDMVMDEVFAESASYYYLIKRAAERNLYPGEETKAIGKMNVTPVDVPISIGDRFNLDALNYTVTSIIDASIGEYQIECETAGIVGNQQLGQLLPIETVNELNNMESAELTEILIPGEDEEDVEAFRERYFASFNNEAFGGNKTDYINKVNEIDGIGGCKVVRAWEQGYNPASMLPGDTVSLWFQQQSEETLEPDVYQWIKRVYVAAKEKLLTTGGTVKVIIISSDFEVPSNVLVDTAQQILDPTMGEGAGLAPIGHVVNVIGVKDVLIDVELSITYKDGYSSADMKEPIEETLDAYYLELRQSWKDNDNLVVRISQIESRLLSLDGIVDVAGTMLNGKNENLVLGEDEIPRRGDVIG